jgi:hypothetical protein
MKCVRTVDYPLRLTNEDARALIDAGKAEYCPKHVFREYWLKCENVKLKSKVFDTLEGDRERGSKHDKW